MFKLKRSSGSMKQQPRTVFVLAQDPPARTKEYYACTAWDSEISKNHGFIWWGERSYLTFNIIREDQVCLSMLLFLPPVSRTGKSTTVNQCTLYATNAEGLCFVRSRRKTLTHSTYSSQAGAFVYCFQLRKPMCVDSSYRYDLSISLVVIHRP